MELHRPKGEGLLFMWQKSTGNEYVAIELLPRLFTQDKEAKMKENEQHENYGLYITQNTYTMEFYCFNRDAARGVLERRPLQEGIGQDITGSTKQLQEWKFIADEYTVTTFALVEAIRSSRSVA
jgi:hypothetical protein